jgi:hypothetical protein
MKNRLNYAPIRPAYFKCHRRRSYSHDRSDRAPRRNPIAPGNHLLTTNRQHEPKARGRRGLGPKAQVMFILGQRAKARGGLEGVTSCQSVACDTSICFLRLR